MKKYVVAGKRTPFVHTKAEYSGFSTLQLSEPVVTAMAKQARPDFVFWGQMLPNPSVSNLAREIVLQAGLGADIPASGTLMGGCSSLFAAIQAASMLSAEGWSLGLVGGVEAMSQIPVLLHTPFAQKMLDAYQKDPESAGRVLEELHLKAFDIPIGKQGDYISNERISAHTEHTARYFNISRKAQDTFALKSHKKAIAAAQAGFFDDLITPFAGVKADTIPNPDLSLEGLSGMATIAGSSAQGTLTSGNVSASADGAAAVWIANKKGLERLGAEPEVEFVDWQAAAMESSQEGALMAPARAMPVLLQRRGLKFSDIAFWECHEALAVQALANFQAAENPQYRRWKAGVDDDLGDFPWDRLNPHGGSLAHGHPVSATGARILSQAAKALRKHAIRDYALASICADGGQGVCVLLRRVEN